MIEKRLEYCQSKLSSDTHEKHKDEKAKDKKPSFRERGHVVGNVVGTLVPGARLAAKLAPDREEITQFMSGASEGFTNGGGYEKKK